MIRTTRGLFNREVAKHTIKQLIAFIVSLITSFIILEGVFILFFSYPIFVRVIPSGFFKNLYMHKVRNIVQFMPSCAQYDPEITYTLRPGSFLFSNPEFKNRFWVNRLGVRDDAESLIKPEIVILGDSVAMGWGVDQEDTYAQIIEKRTGRKVLNASVSSYGTVREMRMLDRIDTSHLKWLIVDYQTNDMRENEIYYLRGNRLHSSDRKKYEENIKNHASEKKYYFGKYTLEFVRQVLHPAFKKIFREGFRCGGEPPANKTSTENREKEALLFLNALAAAPRTDLSKTGIIVLGEGDFISALSKSKGSPEYPPYFKNIIAMDPTKNLDKHCYYVLDDHLNKKGHASIADELIRRINFGP